MKSWLPRKRLDLEIRNAESELLVLDRRGGKIHKFNESASLIFACCDGRHTIKQIIDRVAKKYGTQIEIVKHDVDRTIESFANLGLLINRSGVIEEES